MTNSSVILNRSCEGSRIKAGIATSQTTFLAMTIRMEKQDIKNFTVEELEERLAEIPAPPFRARQISEWLYRKGVSDFSQMKNLPKDLQERLDTIFYVSRPEIAEIARSAD